MNTSEFTHLMTFNFRPVAIFKTELQAVISECRRTRLLVDKLCCKLINEAVTIVPVCILQYLRLFVHVCYAVLDGTAKNKDQDFHFFFFLLILVLFSLQI